MSDNYGKIEINPSRLDHDIFQPIENTSKDPRKNQCFISIF